MDHTDVVAQVKADLEAQHVDLTGPCGAFQITQRVAWSLRTEGTGLLDKPQGNNCLGYATDIVCYPSGAIVDILVDAGAGNVPQWRDAGVVDPARYRPAVDPGDSPPPPVPTPTPPPPDVEAILQRIFVYVDARFSAIDAVLADLVQLASMPPPIYRGKLAATIILKPVKETP